MKTIRFGIVAALVVLMTGCATMRGPHGYLRDPNNDLSDTRTMPELKYPPGVPVLPTDPYFIVNQVGTVPAAINMNLVPPGSLAALNQNATKQAEAGAHQ